MDSSVVNGVSFQLETKKYSPQEVALLNVWKDRIAGWRWLHYNSMNHYKRINARFTYSSIVLSTLAGAGGFSSAGDGGKNTVTKNMGYIIGVVNVIIGLLNSFQRFGKPAEKTELHQSAAMQYAMLYRTLETELSLTEEHKNPDLIKMVRAEMDRLLALSPPIPGIIVKSYNVTFPNAKYKPDVCNGMSGEKIIPESFIKKVYARLSRRGSFENRNSMESPGGFSRTRGSNIAESARARGLNVAENAA